MGNFNKSVLVVGMSECNRYNIYYHLAFIILKKKLYLNLFQEQIYTGTDISLVLKEIQTAQDVINKIKEMRQGMMGSALVSIMNEVCSYLCIYIDAYFAKTL